MQTDLYTKAVLTVIAIALTLIAGQMSIPDAHAQRFSGDNGIQMVAICNPVSSGGRTNCADVIGDRLQVTAR